MMEGFHDRYGHYPKYCTTDAVYGSFNNYLWEKERGMELFQKFPTYEKESKGKGKDKNDPFKPANFPISEEGDMICPNGKHIKFQRNQPVRGNKYGRTEEVWQCALIALTGVNASRARVTFDAHKRSIGISLGAAVPVVLE